MSGTENAFIQSIVYSVICLSKNLTDEYVNMFAKGAGLAIYKDDPGTDDILVRSIAKKQLIKECWNTGRTFFYMDSGYVGNYISSINPRGDKLFHRIVKNNLQHTSIVERPDNRWKKLNYNIEKRKSGNHILLVTPSEKPCKFYNINLDAWIDKTVKEIKKYTDRPVVIRNKAPRQTRIEKTIFDDLNGAHALVTFNSIAAIESVLYGVPAFTLAPTAADTVCDKELSLLETPTVQDEQKIHKWAHHLAYGQFHINEFKDGSAYKLLYEEC